MTWNAAIEEAYASAPVDDYVVRTLELIHPAFVDDEDAADSIRVSLDDRSWDLEIETGAPLFAGETKTFEPLAMEITLPEQGESGFGSLKMALDNIPRDVFRQISAAATVRASAILIYREFVAERDTETGEYSVSGTADLIIDQLTVKVVDATVLRIEATATFVDLLNKAFPTRTFNRDDFPGLFGVNE